MRPALVLASLLLAVPPLAGQSKESTGLLPAGRDGKPLNLDFETGTLKDWVAEGEAFKNQPIKGDTVFPRRNDNKSEHQGDYWIGGYERHGDKPQGTLTSTPFKVTHPWASFLVGGAPHETTCVELRQKDDGVLIHRASGLEEENLRRIVVDLKDQIGREIFIRIVDKHSGHWGHVNFDDFRFHSEKPKFPQRPSGPAQPDVYKFAGLPPEKAAQVMTVPEGFDVKLFAGEPDVQQPIAMCLDDRGRVWVAEAYSYPIRRSEKEAKDRILIFEDADGDGKFDKRTVFMEGLNLVSGLEVGFGGVWIGAAPYLLFVPMKDDKPSGPPQVLLDGWGYQDTHETLNSFIWGPDGWLYGCHGVFTHSKVGKPGTPDDQRVPINAGVWRYHPTKHKFDVFAHGTSNPWGLDFNDHGQAFVEACVIPHCFHIIQGGRYHRQAGPHFNAHTYDDIKTIADHFHYVGPNPHGGNNRSDSAGGGHAHCGLMCYLGGSWPKEYRNQLFMGNIHGRRINVDIPRPEGSGYVAVHGKDFLMTNDAWSRLINFRYGPDGNVYVIDWYDKQACHHGDPKIWDRTNGRIFKVSYRGTKSEPVDLATKTDQELVELQLHENDWYVRHARRLLQERAARNALQPAIHEALEKIATTHKDETRRLRALWALYVTGGLGFEQIEKALTDSNEFMRGWTIQLAVEADGTEVLRVDKLVELAEKDESPVVRRYLASALQQLTFEQRERVLQRLLVNDDGKDRNLPYLYWYALEPLAGVREHRQRALDFAAKSSLATLLPYTVRRVGADAAPEAIELLVDSLGKADQPAAQRAILKGINEALKGRRQVPMPAAWPPAFAKIGNSQNADIRNQAVALAITFGDASAFAEMRRLLTANAADAAQRHAALDVLVAAKDKELPPILHKLIDDSTLRGAALRGLAQFDDPQTPAVILGQFASWSAAEKRDAISTLAARKEYARALLDAVGAKKIPSADISADIVRQLRNLGDPALTKRITEVWGVVRDTPADRKKLIAQYQKMLKSPPLQVVDLALGRAIYAKTCQNCHTMYGVGGKVGPDITGSNRANLDYLLENILDPSAVIQKEYAATIIELKNGRFITGIVRNETPAALTVLTANETLTVARDDIDSVKPTPTSMMPDDQLKDFKQHEIRALFAYLQHPAQTPILATRDNAKDFFNGKDLTGWDGDPKLWRVENGEIIGKSPGIKHNEFLRSHLMAGDFKLSLQVKLTPNKENSGIQFRSEAMPNGDVKGYQADIGAGWWGKLYEELGRAILWDKSGESSVKTEEWNRYEIEAKGSKIRTWINGQLSVDLDDPSGARRGIFALQIHSGGPMEVRFKDLKLELPKD
jgi:putative membrane-bound dehydrogenase-like protein